MATPSGILTWEIQWIKEPGGQQSVGHKDSDTTQQLNHHHHLFREETNFLGVKVV